MGRGVGGEGELVPALGQVGELVADHPRLHPCDLALRVDLRRSRACTSTCRSPPPRWSSRRRGWSRSRAAAPAPRARGRRAPRRRRRRRASGSPRRAAAGGSWSCRASRSPACRRRSAPRPRPRRRARAPATSGRSPRPPPAPASVAVARGPLMRRNSSASARFSSRPWPGRERSGTSLPPSGSSVPSNSIRSIRTWSWKYSRCASVSTAQQAWAEIAGAQWAEKRRCAALQIPSARSRLVIPPTRVTSACTMSTQRGQLAEPLQPPLVLAGGDRHPGRAVLAHEAPARRGPRS